ncbi:hypothetical protein [Luteimonas sp. R10]|uniref:hypothetical protein n=1 Tax=Luteimonas sp. R10 TaxID=3108176 RepID=UPI00308DEFE3|nr:hypothetical protein U3649_02875 [Luteimonas sp. R10]
MSRRPIPTMCRLSAVVSLAVAIALAACAAEAPEAAATPAPVAADPTAPVDPTEAAAPETEASPQGQAMETWVVAAQAGGALHALAEACDDYSAGELQRMKAEQEQAVVAAGGDPDRFETVFASSYGQAKQKIASVTKAELAKECAAAQQMKAMAEQMGQQNQP